MLFDRYLVRDLFFEVDLFRVFEICDVDRFICLCLDCERPLELACCRELELVLDLLRVREMGLDLDRGVRFFNLEGDR